MCVDRSATAPTHPVLGLLAARGDEDPAVFLVYHMNLHRLGQRNPNLLADDVLVPIVRARRRLHLDAQERE